MNSCRRSPSACNAPVIGPRKRFLRFSTTFSLTHRPSCTRTCNRRVLRKATHSPCKRFLSLNSTAPASAACRRPFCSTWRFVRSGISPVTSFPGESCSVRYFSPLAQFKRHQPIRALRRRCWSYELDSKSHKRYCPRATVLARGPSPHAHGFASFHLNALAVFSYIL